MGRTNTVLLAMGGLTIVALSLMMQYAIGVQRDHQRDPILQELMEVYGPRLEAEPQVRYVKFEGGRRATVEIHPLVGITPRRLARQIGEHVWRRVEGLNEVEVVCFGLAGEPLESFDVPRPYMTPAPVPTPPPVPPASAPPEKTPETPEKAPGGAPAKGAPPR